MRRVIYDYFLLLLVGVMDTVVRPYLDVSGKIYQMRRPSGQRNGSFAGPGI